jgi:DNA topoisomerase-1
LPVSRTEVRVEASYGHIRDLPESASEVPAEIKGKSWGRLGVDTDGDFTPYYVVPADKKKNVTALKAAMKDASELILATDPDREGESISWHLKELLKPKVKVRRIVFHEITEEAVKAALAEAHDVDENLVRAQESRRILDRLYGYTLSPVLWKKVQTGLSAGRVQSVAVRVIVEREEERLAFRAGSYWDLEAKLRGGSSEFVATLAKVGGQRVATGKDFDSKGNLESNTVRLLGEKDAELREGPCAAAWSTSVKKKTVRSGRRRRSQPPRCSRKPTVSWASPSAPCKLLASVQGMDLGGGELEGLISYHRTDSTTLSTRRWRSGAVVELGADFTTAPIPDEGPQRPGSARSDSSDGFPPTPASLKDSRATKGVMT